VNPWISFAQSFDPISQRIRFLRGLQFVRSGVPHRIDIRKGPQYECIGCGACADVCDTVMDKMGYRGGGALFHAEWRSQPLSSQQILKPLFVSLKLIYTAILGAVVLALMLGLLRTPFRSMWSRSSDAARLASGA
jgi:polyferredoxin